MNEIKIESIDETRVTSVTISCYRETHRLGRVLRVFQKALTLARKDGRDGQLLACIVGLHDHKGTLTATWRPSVWETDNAVDPDLPDVFLDVERAWADENEVLVEHVVAGVGGEPIVRDAQPLPETLPEGATLQ